jgi:hypothetical protein
MSLDIIFFVHTNHYSINHLMNKPDLNGRKITWIMLLQQFDLSIIDKPIRKNVVVELLSRLTNPANGDMVDDHFPDEHFFSILEQTPWFAGIANYLTIGRFPKHLSYKEKCKIVIKSVACTWII